jgi:hypothetical protein
VLPEMARGHATSGTWVCVSVLALLALFEALCMWLLKKVNTHALVLIRGRLWESAVTPCRPVPWVTHCMFVCDAA